MENKNFDINKYLMESSKSIKDYIYTNYVEILNHLYLSSVSILILAILYAIYSKKIYASSVTLK